MKFQKSNKFDKFLPYYPIINKKLLQHFEHIKENIYLSISKCNFRPGLLHWTHQMRLYIIRHGWKFTYSDHITLIKLYYKLTVETELDFDIIHECILLLIELLKKHELIEKYTDIVFDHEPLLKLYNLTVIDRENDDKNLYSIIHFPKNFGRNLEILIRHARIYFKKDIWYSHKYKLLLPILNPYDIHIFEQHMHLLELFLPSIFKNDSDFLDNIVFSKHTTDLPIIIDTGNPVNNFLATFVNLFASYQNFPCWEKHLIALFARISEHNVGRIVWSEKLVEILFSKFLTGLNLPISGVALAHKSATFYKIPVFDFAKWIINSIPSDNLIHPYKQPQNNENYVQTRLNSLLNSIETYLHPSNAGKWTGSLVKLINSLVTCMQNRLYHERNKKFKWETPVPVEARLTNAQIVSFVAAVKPLMMLLLFDKHHYRSIQVSLKTVVSFAPHLMLPELLNTISNAFEIVLEPHRLKSCLAAASIICLPLSKCLRSILLTSPPSPIQSSTTEKNVLNISNSIEFDTDDWNIGDIDASQNILRQYFELLNQSVVGIDPNDPPKSMASLMLISALTSLTPIADLSNHPYFHNDENKHSSTVIEFVHASSDMFRSFLFNLLDKCFKLADSLDNSSFDYGGFISAGGTTSTMAGQSMEELKGGTNVQTLRNADETSLSLAMMGGIETVLRHCSTDLYKEAVEYVLTRLKNILYSSKQALEIVADLCLGVCISNVAISFPIIITYLIARVKQLLNTGYSNPNNNYERKEDPELVWYAHLLSHSIKNTGTQVLLVYENDFLNILDLGLKINLLGKDISNAKSPFLEIPTEIFEIFVDLLANIMSSLTKIYIKDYKNLNPVDWKYFITQQKDFKPNNSTAKAPFELWSKLYKLNEVELEWNVPTETGLHFVHSLIKRYVEPCINYIGQFSRKNSQNNNPKGVSCYKEHMRRAFCIIEKSIIGCGYICAPLSHQTSAAKDVLTDVRGLGPFAIFEADKYNVEICNTAQLFWEKALEVSTQRFALVSYPYINTCIIEASCNNTPLINDTETQSMEIDESSQSTDSKNGSNKTATNYLSKPATTKLLRKLGFSDFRMKLCNAIHTFLANYFLLENNGTTNIVESQSVNTDTDNGLNAKSTQSTNDDYISLGYAINSYRLILFYRGYYSSDLEAKSQTYKHIKTFFGDKFRYPKLLPRFAYALRAQLQHEIYCCKHLDSKFMDNVSPESLTPWHAVIMNDLLRISVSIAYRGVCVKALKLLDSMMTKWPGPSHKFVLNWIYTYVAIKFEQPNMLCIYLDPNTENVCSELAQNPITTKFPNISALELELIAESLYGLIKGYSRTYPIAKPTDGINSSNHNKDDWTNSLGATNYFDDNCMIWRLLFAIPIPERNLLIDLFDDTIDIVLEEVFINLKSQYCVPCDVFELLALMTPCPTTKFDTNYIIAHDNLHNIVANQINDDTHLIAQTVYKINFLPILYGTKGDKNVTNTSNDNPIWLKEYAVISIPYATDNTLFVNFERFILNYLLTSGQTSINWRYNFVALHVLADMAMFREHPLSNACVSLYFQGIISSAVYESSLIRSLYLSTCSSLLRLLKFPSSNFYGKKNFVIRVGGEENASTEYGCTIKDDHILQNYSIYPRTENKNVLPNIYVHKGGLIYYNLLNPLLDFQQWERNDYSFDMMVPIMDTSLIDKNFQAYYNKPYHTVSKSLNDAENPWSIIYRICSQPVAIKTLLSSLHTSEDTDIQFDELRVNFFKGLFRNAGPSLAQHYLDWIAENLLYVNSAPGNDKTSDNSNNGDSHIEDNFSNISAESENEQTRNHELIDSFVETDDISLDLLKNYSITSENAKEIQNILTNRTQNAGPITHTEIQMIIENALKNKSDQTSPKSQTSNVEHNDNMDFEQLDVPDDSISFDGTIINGSVSVGKGKASLVPLSIHCLAAEIFAGWLRATKYWPLDHTLTFFHRYKELLTECILKGLTPENFKFWRPCFGVGCESRDPRHIYWLLDYFTELCQSFFMETPSYTPYVNPNHPTSDVISLDDMVINTDDEAQLIANSSADPLDKDTKNQINNQFPPIIQTNMSHVWSTLNVSYTLKIIFELFIEFNWKLNPLYPELVEPIISLFPKINSVAFNNLSFGGANTSKDKWVTSFAKHLADNLQRSKTINDNSLNIDILECRILSNERNGFHYNARSKNLQGAISQILSLPFLNQDMFDKDTNGKLWEKYMNIPLLPSLLYQICMDPISQQNISNAMNYFDYLIQQIDLSTENKFLTDVKQTSNLNSITTLDDGSLLTIKIFHRVLNTVLQEAFHPINQFTLGFLPFSFYAEKKYESKDPIWSRELSATRYYISRCLLLDANSKDIANMYEKMVKILAFDYCTTKFWKTRTLVWQMLRDTTFCNAIFESNNNKQISMKHMVWRFCVAGLLDPVIEVREKAKDTLSGLLRCKYFPLEPPNLYPTINKEIQKFHLNTQSYIDMMNYLIVIGQGKKSDLKPNNGFYYIHPQELNVSNLLSAIYVGSKKDVDITTFDQGRVTPILDNFYAAGILGLCAIVESFPYDIPHFLPSILIKLSNIAHNTTTSSYHTATQKKPNRFNVNQIIRKTMANFKRTHLDNWSEHKQKFTDEQSEILSDLLVSPNYYA